MGEYFVRLKCIDCKNDLLITKDLIKNIDKEHIRNWNKKVMKIANTKEKNIFGKIKNKYNERERKEIIKLYSINYKKETKCPICGCEQYL